MPPIVKNNKASEEFSYKKWERKRKFSTIIFGLQNVLIGVDDGLVISTLWMYIETLFKPHNPEFFYSLILLSFCVTSIITSIIIAKIADQTRNVRLIFLICNTIACCGNFLYTIHFSPWYLVAARILCGFTYPLKSVIIGELTRTYEKEDISSKVAQVSLMFMVGYIAVPVINCGFINVHLRIGDWHIAYGNIPGLVVGSLRLLVIILIIFLLHNTSKEYDLKADKLESCELIDRTDMTESLTDSNITKDSTLLLSPEDQEMEKKNMENRSNSTGVLNQLFTHWETALLIATSFFDTVLMTTFKMMDPILIFNIWKWPVSVINGYILALSLCIIVPSLICGLRKFSDKAVFITAVLSYFGFILLQINYMVSFLYHKSFGLNVFLIVVRPILFTNCLVVEEIFIAGFLAKMVSTKYQTFADSIRISVAMFGEVFAEGTAVLAYSRIAITGPFYILVLVILIVLIICRRKTFQNPQIIIR